jgi:hypothetical protein
MTFDRLSLVLFQASEGDLRMEPAYGGFNILKHG